MKGIIMAGGKGSRLAPLTSYTSKHLLPVYDKPMIYYPLATLMLAGINEILMITTPEHQSHYKNLLKDGKQWGISIEYLAQAKPSGIAEGLILSEDFIANESVGLILGDNIFYGQQMGQLLQNTKAAHSGGADIFAYWVKDPERYGVLAFNDQKQPIDILEKPKVAPSQYAVTGLYFYDNNAPQIARDLKPSHRGELEITDVNKVYLAEGLLNVVRMGRGNAWLDTGTPEALLDAGEFFKTIEERQGLKINAPEEVAWRLGYITNEELQAIASTLKPSLYGDYLSKLAEEECMV